MSTPKDFSNIGAEFRKKRESKAPEAPAERNFEEIRALRARILGVLLRDARTAHGNTQAEVAEALQTSEETIRDWEYGRHSPSLPQLEMFAYVVGVPVSHFWGDKTISAEDDERDLPVSSEAFSELRDRVIGVRLAVARKEAKLSQEEVAQTAGLPVERVVAYEQGAASVPFPEMASLASAVRRSISYFVEQTGQVGRWLRLQEEYRRFCELPEELRAFVSQPVNEPFIEIAMRLSKMPVQELRLVAEKILDIVL